jgi:hypothetical protein
MVWAVRRRATTAVLSGLAVALAWALSLFGAAEARAAETERVAGPSAGGTTCTQARPCAITRAIDNAVSGQTVTIDTGTYGAPTPLTKTLTVPAGVTVRGEAGQPRPVIITEAPSGILLGGEGSSVGGLEVQDTTGEYGISAATAGSSIADVIAHVSAPAAIACRPSEALTDSVCWSSGSNGVAAEPLGTATVSSGLRNDTLIAQASGGVGLAVHARLGVTVTANLTNSIALGGQVDVLAATETRGTPTAIVNADHSDYATTEEHNTVRKGTVTVTPAGSGANQTGAPVFVDEATGDFRESASSLATIGKGVNSPLNGPTDLEGNPRELFGATDIGAYELSPPPTCAHLNASATVLATATIQLQCTDPAGAPLTYAITGPPAHGSASLNPTTGQILYRPTLGYTGPDSLTYDASSRNGTAAPATVAITVNPLNLHLPGNPHPIPLHGAGPVPVLSDLRQSAKIWREGNAPAALTAAAGHTRPPLGTTFSFTLSEAATVSFTFTRQASGRRLDGRCVAPSKSNVRAHRCERSLTTGVLAIAARGGKDRVRFDGLLARHKRLAPGSYTVLVRAVDSGRRSITRYLRLTISGLTT